MNKFQYNHFLISWEKKSRNDCMEILIEISYSKYNQKNKQDKQKDLSSFISNFVSSMLIFCFK